MNAFNVIISKTIKSLVAWFALILIAPLAASAAGASTVPLTFFEYRRTLPSPGECPEQQCEQASGYRIQANGDLFSFVLYNSDATEKVRKIGKIDFTDLMSYRTALSQIRTRNAALTDEAPSEPMCADSPKTEATFFYTDAFGTTSPFILSKYENCHRFMRWSDTDALIMAYQAEDLARLVARIVVPGPYLLLERTIYGGLHPIDAPIKETTQVYTDGKIYQEKVYIDESKNQRVLQKTVDKFSIESLENDAVKFFVRAIQIQDPTPEVPRCTDAPITEYRVGAITGAGFQSVLFSQTSNCHTFFDPKLQNETQSLIRFFSTLD